MIFVVTEPENYHKYFMTEDEIENWMKIQEKKYPRTYIERPKHELNSEYDHYYNAQEYYYK